MSYFSKFSPFFLVTFLSIAACSGQTLDGGSNTSGGASSGSEPSAGDPGGGGAGSSAAAEAPLEGQIAGKPFTPVSVQLEFSKANNQWFLSLRNYPLDCGGVVDDPSAATGAEKMVVTIGGVEAAAGTYSIEYDDSHAATFQVGVYEANGPKPETSSADKGTLRFDAWSETPGSTVPGYLELSNDESSVKGTFTATVCKPR